MPVPIDYQRPKRSSSQRTWPEILCLLSFPLVSIGIAILLVLPSPLFSVRLPVQLLPLLLLLGPIALLASGVPLLITIQSRTTWEVILFRVLFAIALLAWMMILWLMLTD